MEGTDAGDNAADGTALWQRRRPALGHPSRAAPAPRDALDLLEQFGTTISVQRDREIHGQGDQADCCYRILSGCVRMVKLMEDGRRQIGEFLMAGDLLGFDALGTYDFAAEAVSDVVLRRYPRRMVDALAESNVALTRRLRDMTVGQPAHWLMRGWCCWAARPRRSGSPPSCWRWRSGCRNAHAHVLDLPMSRTDIADHLGLTIETVCRVLAHLRREGTIAIEPRQHHDPRRRRACSRWRQSRGTEQRSGVAAIRRVEPERTPSAGSSR